MSNAAFGVQAPFRIPHSAFRILVSFEKFAMKALYRFDGVAVRDDEREIDLRRSLRNHLDRHRRQRLEYARGYAGSIAEPFAHHAHDGPLPGHRDLAELAQVFQQL